MHSGSRSDFAKLRFALPCFELQVLLLGFSMGTPAASRPSVCVEVAICHPIFCEAESLQWSSLFDSQRGSSPSGPETCPPFGTGRPCQGGQIALGCSGWPSGEAHVSRVLRPCARIAFKRRAKTPCQPLLFGREPSGQE